MSVLPRAIRLFAALAFVLTVLAWRPAASQSSLEPPATPFLAGSGPLVVVDVMVNGSGPWPFLVDTGSSHSSIDSRLARTLGAPRVAKTLVSTWAGSEWAPVVRLDRVSVGPLTGTDLLATELPPARIDDSGRIAGVIGWDLLATRSFSIDYARRAIEWTDLADDDADNDLRLERVGDVWMIDARAGSTRLRLIPDSGSETTVLFDRGRRLRVATAAGSAGIRSVTGVRPSRSGVLSTLTLGSLQLRDHPVVVVDDPGVDAGHGDGLLALHLFDAVCFRPGEGVVELRRRAAPAGVQPVQ